MQNRSWTIRRAVAIGLLNVAAAGAAFAADGQVVINQARAMAGGVTAGDAPGFPVTISKSGSYVLTGLLKVPDANTDAISIQADHVTVNLNGFSILGPTDCSGGLNPCAGAGRGRGIVAGVDYAVPRFNITIRNGTIQGMGSDGIRIYGDSALVEDMHVRSNGGSGIVIETSYDAGGSIVQKTTAQRNSVDGIFVRVGLVTDSVVMTNGFAGIAMNLGTVSGNTVTRNYIALSIAQAVGYVSNVLADNVTNVPTSGRSLGHNQCGTTLC